MCGRLAFGCAARTCMWYVYLHCMLYMRGRERVCFVDVFLFFARAMCQIFPALLSQSSNTSAAVSANLFDIGNPSYKG